MKDARSHIQRTMTSAVLAATCTNGVPASKQHPADYPIDHYTLVKPAANWTSYVVRKEWYDQHLVSGPHYMAFSHTSDPYGAFKCQYTCNAATKCISYFVSYEEVGTGTEHLSCVLFDAILHLSEFELSADNIGAGGYDKLCQS
ncbi:hypothetical protein B0H67DRAFT_483272 [Lasiosphaeris hirsuta]|uniref:Uncharacterized protein n=1 Tax=Lasiosphaeris hirsuta TaxID=260670 RepID=A0AA40DY36_9PEZI|nr:hypothetical protein B0H67DRAFT_483272 [Lasiosphaeris hirsuta]